MAYALVGLAVLVLGLAVAVASLQRRVRDLADRLDGLAPAALAPITPSPVEPHPVTITDLGGTDPEPRPVRRVSLGTPMIKLAAISYGVRRALGEDTRTLAAVTMRRELKRQRRQHRRERRRDAATSSPAQTHGWIS
jgi:hypothetical protein